MKSLQFPIRSLPVRVAFHMWVPDVYDGAPTSTTLFIAAAPKLAACGMILRLLAEGLEGLFQTWQEMLIAASLFSIVLGNVVAIAQTNLKRMLGYSTISHVGFILMGFVAGTEEGLQAAMFYTLTYVLMAAAAFGMIIVLSRKGFEAEDLEDFKRDLDAGELSKDDREYIAALHERLVVGGGGRRNTVCLLGELAGAEREEEGERRPAQGCDSAARPEREQGEGIERPREGEHQVTVQVSRAPRVESLTLGVAVDEEQVDERETQETG